MKANNKNNLTRSWIISFGRVMVPRFLINQPGYFPDFLPFLLKYIYGNFLPEAFKESITFFYILLLQSPYFTIIHRFNIAYTVTKAIPFSLRLQGGTFVALFALHGEDPGTKWVF